MFVKIFFLLSLYHVALVRSDELAELLALIRKTCLEKTGTDEALVIKANVEKILSDEPNFKCYINCVLEMSHCLKDDGLVNPEAIIAALPKHLADDRLKNVVRACGGKKGEDQCNSSWLTYVCYLENNHETFFLY